MIGDLTESPRPHAYKTSYVGKLKDGETRGFCLLTLATLYCGRAIPFSALPARASVAALVMLAFHHRLT